MIVEELTPSPVSDDVAPVVQLNGDNPMSLFVGDIYQEPNASATDNVDGSVPVSISGSVNTSAVGVYTITYSASDAASNIANVTRIVNVESVVLPPMLGQVDVYPSPAQEDGITVSATYKVNVIQHEVSQNSYVNKSVNNNTTSNGANLPERLLTDNERENKLNQSAG